MNLLFLALLWLAAHANDTCKKCLEDFKKNKGCLALKKCNNKGTCDQVDFGKFLTTMDPETCTSTEIDCEGKAFEKCEIEMVDHGDKDMMDEKCKACLADFGNNKGCDAMMKCREEDNCDDVDFTVFFKDQNPDECLSEEMDECNQAVMKMCKIEGELEPCKRDKSLEGKVFDVPDDGCEIDGEAVECGAGFISMQYWEDGGSCDENDVSWTSCLPIGGVACEGVLQQLNDVLEEEGGKFVRNECTRNDVGEEQFSMIVKCEEGGADCESEGGKLCASCKGMFDICKDMECPDDSDDVQCKNCKSCEMCKPYAKCDVRCDADIVENCPMCWSRTEECKPCENNMKSKECALCSQCRACKPFEKCKEEEGEEEEVDCKSDQAKQCSQCKQCIPCVGVETEDCATNCDKCSSCVPFAGCYMEEFCDENKEHDCMKCKGCVGCFDDQMKGTEACALCKDCQQCKGFGLCMTGGLEVCKSDKIGPILVKHIPKDKVQKCLYMMSQPVDDTLSEDECQCLLAVPEDVMEENNCWLQTESVGSMRLTCKNYWADKDINDCSSNKNRKKCKAVSACEWKKGTCRKLVVKCNKIKSKDKCYANETCKSKYKKKGFKCVRRKKN